MTQLPPMDLFGALLFQIAGQQLSVAATRQILGRIEARFGRRLPSAPDVLATDPARFRDAGRSLARSASVMPARTCSSCAKIVVPLRPLISIGRIWSVKRPPEIAAAARWWLCIARAS